MGKKNKLGKFIFIHELTTGNTVTIIYAAFFLNVKDGYNIYMYAIVRDALGNLGNPFPEFPGHLHPPIPRGIQFSILSPPLSWPLFPEFPSKATFLTIFFIFLKFFTKNA
jgi:hypothetical protein